MNEERVQVILFQVGARVFAAGVHDVVRIGNVREVPAAELVVETAVGMPFDRERGVVVFGDDGVDRTLVVDQVLGVRNVPQSDVVALPAFAAACLTSGAVIGFVVVDDAPVLLLDLPTLVRERPGAAPDHRAA